MQSKSRYKNFERGQVLIEYLLLMVIVIASASILMKGLINREPGKQGALIKAWDGIIRTIGNDLPDCKQSSFSTPNCQP